VANNYLQFSEVIPHLTEEEEAWLQEQLEVVYVFGDREYTEERIPDELDEAPDWEGCRAWRDLEEYNPDSDEPVGFQYEFCEPDTDELGRHLWIYAEEWGYPSRVAHLVRKFLKTFRPDEFWALTYAATCSKPRIGEFGGGAAFVTAAEIQCQDAWDFIETQIQAFEEGGGRTGSQEAVEHNAPEGAVADEAARRRKTRLIVEIAYDPSMTDPEGLPVAMDRLLETALSIPGVLDDYGNPKIGEFFVADAATDP